MKTQIMVALITVAVSAHATEPECTLNNAFRDAIFQSTKLESADNANLLATLTKLDAMESKAKGTGPIREQLSQSEQQQFNTPLCQTSCRL